MSYAPLNMAQLTDAVLKVFGSYKLQDLQTEQTAGVTEDTGVYFAKFLTSPMLLDLQLADTSFRRQILVQFLVLFCYLETKSKFKKYINSIISVT